MTMPAVVMALEAMNRPDVVKRQLRRPLPSDLIDLIKCAAGDRATLERLTAERDVTEDDLVRASKFFLLHVVTSGGNDNYRTLGLPKTAEKEDVREHRRWLLKWLHPDRNPSKWESALFLKVETAANQLVSAEPTEAVVIPFPKSARSRTQNRSSRPQTAFAADTDMTYQQTGQRTRQILILSCLAISVLSLLLFGLSEWYPRR